jgi:hypothetical protein
MDSWVSELQGLRITVVSWIYSVSQKGSHWKELIVRERERERERVLKGELQSKASVSALLLYYKQRKEHDSRSISAPVKSSLFGPVHLFGQTHSSANPICSLTPISCKAYWKKTEIRCWFEKQHNTNFNSVKNFLLFFILKEFNITTKTKIFQRIQEIKYLF